MDESGIQRKLPPVSMMKEAIKRYQSIHFGKIKTRSTDNNNSPLRKEKKTALR